MIIPLKKTLLSCKMNTFHFSEHFSTQTNFIGVDSRTGNPINITPLQKENVMKLFWSDEVQTVYQKQYEIVLFSDSYYFLFFRTGSKFDNMLTPEQLQKVQDRDKIYANIDYTIGNGPVENFVASGFQVEELYIQLKDKYTKVTISEVLNNISKKTSLSNNELLQLIYENPSVISTDGKLDQVSSGIQKILDLLKVAMPSVDKLDHEHWNKMFLVRWSLIDPKKVTETSDVSVFTEPSNFLSEYQKVKLHGSITANAGRSRLSLMDTFTFNQINVKMMTVFRLLLPNFERPVITSYFMLDNLQIITVDDSNLMNKINFYGERQLNRNFKNIWQFDEDNILGNIIGMIEYISLINKKNLVDSFFEHYDFENFKVTVNNTKIIL